MRMTYDAEADAVYIYIEEDVPVAWTHELDHARILDLDAERKPRGIELLHVSRGVNLNDIPEREEVARLLAEHHIRILSSPASGA
jgi:uncharacterized protein YuzE